MRAIALPVALLVAGAVLGQDPQDAEPLEGYDLSPRYRLGDALEVEARLLLSLKIRMTLPSQNLDRTSEQLQQMRRHYADTLTEVRDGKVATVERRFLTAWDGIREPGSPTIDRAHTPLHARTIEVGLDDEGKRTVRPIDDVEGELPEALLRQEIHTERYEAILPEEPQPIGGEWTVEGDAMARVLGSGFGKEVEGEIRCRFVEFREEALDLDLVPDQQPERYAVISLEVSAVGVPQDEADPRMSAELKGEVYFSMRQRKLAKVVLSGTATLTQVERDGDDVLTVEGKGPLEINKRLWYPRRPTPPEPVGPQHDHDPHDGGDHSGHDH